MVNGTLLEEEIAQIAGHVSNYDFEKAVNQFKNISKKFDLTL